MFSFSSFFSASTMAPICIVAPADVVIDTSSTTMLSFDPMDLSTAAADTTMPQGTKRKLNELYESMGESPRKQSKTTKHPAFFDSRAYRKHESRIIADYHFSTPECHEQASALCTKAALQSLFFQYKPNSYTFDFSLGSNTQQKSRAHDDTMYLFRGNALKPFPVEYLSFIHVPSLVPSPGPVLAAPPAPAPVLVAPPASIPSVTIEDTSMDVVEMPEVPLSDPSRLGKSILSKKKGRMDAAAWGMRHALLDSVKDSKRRRNPSTDAIKKHKGCKKPTIRAQQAPVKPVKQLKMHGPFIEESDDEEEEQKEEKKKETEEESNVMDSTPKTSPPSTTSPEAPTLPSEVEQDSGESSTVAEVATSSASMAPTTQQAHPAPQTAPVASDPSSTATTSPAVDPAVAAAAAAAAATANISQQVGTSAFTASLDDLVDSN